MREKPRARFQIRYEVQHNETLLATGVTSHGFMDKTGKGLRPPKDFLAKVDNAWQPVEASDDFNKI